MSDSYSEEEIMNSSLMAFAETEAEAEEDEELEQPYAGIDDYEDPLAAEQVLKAPIWLVTFGDVTALMLAFFVMLYSMSHLQSERWNEVISIMARRDVPVLEGDPRPVGERTISRISLVPAFPTGYVERILKEKLSDDPLLSKIRMTGLEDQLVLSLPAQTFFEGDGVTLTPVGVRSISRLATVFRLFGNQLSIQGHTDPNPPKEGSPFPDNWSLSLARAVSVAKALDAAGYAGQFTILGLADSVYRHIDREIPEAQRFELAQRVDLVLVPEARGQ